MNAELLVRVWLPYNHTKNDSLKLLSIDRQWDRARSCYTYVFPLKNISQVCSVLGKPIEFAQSDVNEVKNRTPPTSTSVSRTENRGVDEPRVILCPKLIIYETHKRTGDKVTTHRNKLSVELVQAVWHAMLKNPVGRSVKIQTISKHYCRIQGYDRFFRDTNSFDWSKYQGSRAERLELYNAMKVLERLGAITYPGGQATRLKETFELQTHLPINGVTEL